MTIGELRKMIADLPDDYQVFEEIESDDIGFTASAVQIEIDKKNKEVTLQNY